MPKFTSTFYYQLGSLCLLVTTLLLAMRFVPMLETVAAVEQKLGDAGLAAPIAYPLIIAACNLMLLPGGHPELWRRTFFGLWWGFALVLADNLLSAAGAFLLGRKLGRKRIERLLRRRAKWAHLDKTIEREGWKIVVLSQVHPFFPVSLINYIYGITSMRFWPCLMWPLIGASRPFSSTFISERSDSLGSISCKEEAIRERSSTCFGVAVSCFCCC